MTSHQLPDQQLNESQRRDIIACWFNQLSRSPHFSTTTDQFYETSNQLLNTVWHTTVNQPYPSVDTEALSESFSIWHAMLNQHGMEDPLARAQISLASFLPRY